MTEHNRKPVNNWSIYILITFAILLLVMFRQWFVGATIPSAAATVSGLMCALIGLLANVDRWQKVVLGVLIVGFAGCDLYSAYAESRSQAASEDTVNEIASNVRVTHRFAYPIAKMNLGTGDITLQCSWQYSPVTFKDFYFRLERFTYRGTNSIDHKPEYSLQLPVLTPKKFDFDCYDSPKLIEGKLPTAPRQLVVIDMTSDNASWEEAFKMAQWDVGGTPKWFTDTAVIDNHNPRQIKTDEYFSARDWQSWDIPGGDLDTYGYRQNPPSAWQDFLNVVWNGRQSARPSSGDNY